jgi:outer membrane biosynthesis protein TonB
MYFDFEDLHPDTPTMPRALTRLEQGLLTIIAYLLLVILALAWPHLPFVKEYEAQRQQQLEKLRQAELQRQRENARFVFVSPRLDLETKKPKPLADLSDKSRRAQSVERAPNPTNPLPFARGNSPERVEANASRTPSPQPETPASAPRQPPVEEGRQARANPNALTLPDTSVAPLTRSPEHSTVHAPASGVLADAVRNVQRYTGGETFQNLQGGSDSADTSIQFDSKGVDFGPWLRRFLAQVKRNWMTVLAPVPWHGHTVLSLDIHKDGSITAIDVLQPAVFESLTKSAYSALKMSNPTMPLPPEYPDEKCHFTITFFLNEYPDR